MKTFIPSKYQEAFFNWLKTGSGSAVIQAVAGSGKTTTIVQGLELIASHFRVLFMAFNKSIAEELQKRVPSHVLAKTFHSVGFSAWQKYVGKRLNVDGAKMRNILRNICGQEAFELYGAYCIKLVSLAKNAGIGYLLPDDSANWFNLINHFDLSLDSEDADENEAINIARQALQVSISDAIHTIDFDDMLFMPLIRNVSFFQNDFIFIDESQDTNNVQRALVRRMLKPGGRLIAVGDSCQAIYGFRGADSEAMNKIKEEFDAIELPLSISYRCSKAVVNLAKKYVPHIEASETAPEGKIEHVTAFDASLFARGDAIICRNTAPLVELAYALIGRGVGCAVLGREIGAGLVNLIKKMKAKGIENLQTKLSTYLDRETAKLNSRGNETGAAAIEDKIRCIEIVIGHLDENSRTVPALIEHIEKMFSDKAQAGTITLCTAHKSKGLEFDNVFLLDAAKYMPSKFARQAWQKVQENNLIYVAYTRTRLNLSFISMEGLKDRSKTTDNKDKDNSK